MTNLPARNQTNTLAIIGFILALLAIPLGLVLSPIALLICFIALFKRPRGLAFVGFIISSFGTAVLAAILFFFGAIIFLCFTAGSQGFTTAVNIEDAHRQINATIAAHGAVPDDITGNAAIAGKQDGWGHQLFYRRIGPGSFTIQSPGPDGIPGTADDISRDYP